MGINSFLDVVYGDIVDDIYRDKQIVRFYLDDIDRLAKKAVSLSTEASDNRLNNCLRALDEYYRNNIDEDAKLFKQISRSFIAKDLFCNNIQLAIQERDMKINGSDATKLLIYQHMLGLYHVTLEHAIKNERSIVPYRYQ